MKKLTGFAVSEMAEGTMITYSYSVINEQGIIEQKNEAESRIIIDDGLRNNIEAIQSFIKSNFLK